MRRKELATTNVMAHGLLELLVVRNLLLYGTQRFITLFNVHILTEGITMCS
jgi:hypothetical protein